ncbi:MAG: hypothetical protein CMJ81_08905 [Planctomycetaceae bacterium]|nr:hypothetical protein [Planctomycetaceae bacterium]
MPSGLIKKIGLGAITAASALLLAEGLTRLYYQVSGAPLYVAFGSREGPYLRRWLEAHQTPAGSPRKSPRFFGNLGRFDQRLGWAPRPDLVKARTEHHPPVSTNSHGLRSLHEIPYAKPAGRQRIVTMGDSYTFGFGGEDEEIWPVVLDETLGGCEVVNLGVFAYGIDQQLLKLQDEGVKYSPDIVVVGLYEDTADWVLLSFRDFAKPRFQLVNDELQLSNVPVPSPAELLSRYQHRDPPSYAWHWLQQRFRRGSGTREVASSEHRATQQSLTRAIVRQMRREIGDCGAKMLVVFIPANLYTGDSAATIPLRDQLAAWSSELDYAFLDLQPAFVDFSTRELRTVFSDHFNPLGNALVARAVADKLAELGWVAPPGAAALAALETRLEQADSGQLSDLQTVTWQALTLQGQGRHSEAEPLFREALRLNPASPSLLLGLSDSLLARGEDQEAVSHLREAVRLDPEFLLARTNLGAALVRQGKHQAAAEQFQAALRLDPEIPESHFNLGLLFQMGGQLQQAVRHFDQVVRLQPDEFAAHYKLGQLMLRLDRPEEAVTHFEQAIQHNPTFAEAMQQLARIYATHQRPDMRDAAQAVRLARRACELTGQKNPVCLRTLAAAYAESGRFDQSRETVQTALQLARTSGRRPLVALLQADLALYQQGRPRRNGPPVP